MPLSIGAFSSVTAECSRRSRGPVPSHRWIGALKVSSYLVAGAGYFYDRHRALNDCYAALELLAKPLPRSGEPAFKQMLQKAREPSWRIWATHAPFDLKDVLRARGYKWNAGAHGTLRAWSIDVPEDRKEAELIFLETDIYRQSVDIPTRRIDAYTRFSARA